MRCQGRDGEVLAETAQKLGIKLEEKELAIKARQKGFQPNGVLHVIQVPFDTKRDFVLFFIQWSDKQHLIVTSSGGEVLKAISATLDKDEPAKDIPKADAEKEVLAETEYWKQKFK